MSHNRYSLFLCFFSHHAVSPANISIVLSVFFFKEFHFIKTRVFSKKFQFGF